MAKEIRIVIPTAGRAKTMTSHLFVSNSIACVSEKETPIYRERWPDLEIVSHPDSVKGIGMKRQWIYDRFGDVFMMDDDLKGLTKMYPKRGEDTKVEPEAAYWIIQNAANISRLIGVHLFGFNNHVRPEHYHGNVPFRLTGYINGCGLGLLKGAKHLRFNHQIKTNNDFYICGLNAFYYRKCFIDKRFCFNQDSFANNIGGCAEVRTNEVEKADFDLLRRYFGSAIKVKNTGNTAAKHEFSKTLEIPF